MLGQRRERRLWRAGLALLAGALAAAPLVAVGVLGATQQFAQVGPYVFCLYPYRTSAVEAGQYPPGFSSSVSYEWFVQGRGREWLVIPGAVYVATFRWGRWLYHFHGGRFQRVTDPLLAGGLASTAAADRKLGYWEHRVAFP